MSPSPSHHGPSLRAQWWVTLTWTRRETPGGQEHLQDLAAFCADCRYTATSQPSASESLSPTANHQTARKGDQEWRKISTSRRKSSGHQRTSHSQNSSITLARPVCLVNLVFSPYDNTVFGKETAGTALTSCSSIFYNNGSTDTTLNLFSAPSPLLKSLQLLRGSKPNVFCQ